MITGMENLWPMDKPVSPITPGFAVIYLIAALSLDTITTVYTKQWTQAKQ